MFVRLAALSFVLLLLISPSLHAATFTVNSSGDVGDETPDGVCDSDGGLCTLREAISEANASAGFDDINFNVTGTIVESQPAADLVITGPVDIDGSTDPDYAGNPVVTLQGFMLSLSGGSEGSTIRHLEITASPSHGIYVNTSNNQIVGNWIGVARAGVSGNFGHGIEVDTGGVIGNRIATNVISGNNSSGVQNGNDAGLTIVGNVIGLMADGTTPSPNGFNGINVFGDNVTIGGTLPADRNVISNNNGVQVYIGSLVQSTVVRGNFIGTTVTGTGGSTNLLATHGIEQHGNGTLIAENLISGNPRAGISLPENGNLVTRIEANLIGVALNGTTPLPNGDQGIDVSDEDGVLIGGNTSLQGNVIAGNTTYAIEIGAAADGTVIKRNYIGTDATGNVALPTPFAENIIVFGTNTDIGGEGAGNVIAGGNGVGAIGVLGNGTDVLANSIGIGADGATAISGPVTGTVTNGIYVAAANTRIGLPGMGNTIGNHGADGIHIVSAASATAIDSNLIGLRPSGATAAANLSDGIENHGTTTLITSNTISGNTGHGIHLPEDANAGTIIRGNTIGLRTDQTAAVPNNLTGIHVAEDGVNIGTDFTDGNTIAGNVRSGIDVRSTALGTLIRGNYIGVSRNTPAVAIGNGEHGIRVGGGNTLVGSGGTGGNVIGGNTTSGVHVEGGSITSIRGNYIGTDSSGAMLGNIVGITVTTSSDTTIGGSSSFGNYIANNSTHGISLLNPTGVTVLGNHIGVSASGTDAGNLGAGIRISGGSGIIIGGDAASPNVISGNDAWGIEDVGGVTGLAIAANIVGLNPLGTTALPNLPGGIIINSDGVVIGGATVASRNYVSGNGGIFPPGQNILVESAADGTSIRNNIVGLGIDGDTAIANGGDGIRVVGNNTNILTNVVSGNSNGRGIDIAGITGAGTIIRGNVVGLNAAGTSARPNNYGITLTAENVVVGGLAAGDGNFISGNTQIGLEVSANNSIHGNVIGLNAAETAGVPNSTGVLVSGSNNIFGADGGENHIAHNTNHGVAVASGIRNFMTRNSIHDNGQLGIDLFPIGVNPNDDQDPDEGANHLQNYPVLSTAYLQGSTATITGTLNSTPATTFRLEFFSDTNPVPTAEGRTYLGAWTVTTDANGNAPFVYSPAAAPPAGVSLTATATPPDDSTSEFSAAIVLLAPGVFDLSSATYNGSEAAGPITITVNRTGGSDGTVTVDYTTTNGSATAGSDYTTTSGTLTFGPGVTTQQFAVPITDDGTFEGNETFTVALNNPTNGALLGTTTTATVTISNDDGQPQITIGDRAMAEGNSGGTTNATFQVSLSSPSTEIVTVQYGTAPGTADTSSANPDFNATSGTLTFNPGITSLTVDVPIHGDFTYELDETFTVVLSAPLNATILDGTGAGLILNDDGLPRVSIGNTFQSEGDSGQSNARFLVSLSNPSSQTITVQYTTSDGTATAGSDYIATTGTVTFDPGIMARFVDVPVIGDTADEGNEYFTVALSSPINATVEDPPGTGQINDDEAAPTISIGDAAVAESAGSATFTITLSRATSSVVAVSYQTVNGTAIAGSDYTYTEGVVTFAPGETTRNVIVPILDDATAEADETFQVGIITGLVATDDLGQGTITDNDTADLSLSVSAPATVTAGEPVTITVTVSNQGPGDASSVQVTDTLPAGATGAIVTASQGTCVVAAPTITCSLGSILVGATATVTITFNAPAAAGPTTNMVTVTGAQVDADATDNTVVTAITVAAAHLNAIPTLSEWLLVMLAGLLGIAALRRM